MKCVSFYAMYSLGQLQMFWGRSVAHWHVFWVLKELSRSLMSAHP